MEVEAVNQANEIKTYALTSENLKKFEEQLETTDSFHGRRNIPQRTAADGKSEILSTVSFDDKLDNKIEIEDDFGENKPLVRNRRSFYRPERDSARRNPEGRSRDESNSARPLSGKTIFYDDEDYRIPYKDPNHVINRSSRASRKSKQEILYEVSSVSSSSVSQVRTKKKKRDLGTRRSSESSIPTSTSADSDDGVFDDDDFISADSSDDSNDGKTTAGTRSVSSFYPSSVSSTGSVSSIPTNPSRQDSSLSESSPFVTPEERTSVLPSVTTGQTQPGHVKEVLAHPGPQSQTVTDRDPLENVTEQSRIRSSFSRNSMKRSLSRGSSRNGDQGSINSTKTRKTSSREESSISPWSERDTISNGRTSRKDSLMTIDSQSRRGSSVTIRNWSRWSKYSDGGYSITNKVLPLTRHKPRGNRNHSSDTSSFTSDSESSQTDSDYDDDDLSVDRTQALSKMSNLSLEPRPNSTTGENNAINCKNLKTRVRKETENNVEGFDFKHRTKKIPKLRDRPKRPRKGSTTGAVSGQPSSQSLQKTRRKRKGRLQGKEYHSFISQDGQSAISSSSYSASERMHRKASSSATTETKPSQRAKSSVSMTSDSSSFRSSSSMSSSDRRRRRRKNNQLHPLNVVDSGFITDGSPSSRASIRPVDTPFTPALRNRYPSQQSIDSEYSSYPSICGSSPGLSRSASNVSLSSHDSDGESTTVGPEVNETPPAPPIPPKPTVKKHENKPKTAQPEKQERNEEKMEERKEEIKKNTEDEIKEKPKDDPKEEIEKPSSSKVVKLPPLMVPKPPRMRKKSSPYYTSLSPSVEARMNALRIALKIANHARQRQAKREWMYKKVVQVNHPMPSYEEAYRDHGIPRLIKLARPKESKAVWATSFWPVRWGDQTMIFPLSKSAMKFRGTPRLEQLAISKKDFRKDHPEMCGRDAFQYSCGRSSVILGVSPLAMRGEASARVIDLAKPKSTVQAFDEHKQRDNYIFSCGRSSPIWDVSEGAKTTEERERTMSLAHPKKSHPQYQPEKPCIWPVSSAARKASPSPRIELLARPKTRSEGLHREPTWAVPPSAMRTVASARVQELAKAKQAAEGYEHCKELDEPIPRSVLRASATERIKSLSRPIVRETMDHVQFNPDAFKVSPAALKGRMPDRIAELAQPISRR